MCRRKVERLLDGINTFFIVTYFYNLHSDHKRVPDNLCSIDISINKLFNDLTETDDELGRNDVHPHREEIDAHFIREHASSSNGILLSIVVARLHWTNKELRECTAMFHAQD